MKIQEKLEQKYEQCKKEDPKNMERAEKFVFFLYGFYYGVITS